MSCRVDEGEVAPRSDMFLGGPPKRAGVRASPPVGGPGCRLPNDCSRQVHATQENHATATGGVVEYWWLKPAGARPLGLL